MPEYYRTRFDYYPDHVYRNSKAYRIRYHNDIPYITFNRNTRVLYMSKISLAPYINLYGVKVFFQHKPVPTRGR